MTRPAPIIALAVVALSLAPFALFGAYMVSYYTTVQFSIPFNENESMRFYEPAVDVHNLCFGLRHDRKTPFRTGTPID